ncbi:CHAT domain-containing protein [Mycena latifolia]|nr:CHAT domain-containing protein [Mycena latifolia]
MPVETEPSANCWKVRVDCKLPHRPFLQFLVIRHGRLQDFRLIGSVQIRKDNALTSGRPNSPLCLKLVKVNHDGPSLQVEAAFSLVKTSNTEKCKVEGINLSEDRVTSLNDQTILRRLMPIWCSRSAHGLVQLTLLEIRMMHERILLLSAGNKSRKMLLSMLGDISYRQCEGIEDLNQAIAIHRDAAREDPDDASSLVPLGCALCDRFEQLGDVGDINDSVLALEKSVVMGLDSDRAFVLHRLGKSLLLRFYQLGAHDDLHRSLSVLGDADHLTPDRHPDKCEILTELGMAFMSRFQAFGDLDDLKNSISAREDALRLALDGPFDKSLHLEHLGNSLLLQFGRLGDMDSLNRSVSMLEEADRLTPRDHPYRPSKLVNLSNALAVRFEQLGDLADLHRSVVVGDEGICIMPDGHIDKPSALTNLGISLSTRFERLGNMDDLDRSISMHENATEKYRVSLCQGSEQLGEIDALQRSVSVQKHTVRLTLEQHPDKVDKLISLLRVVFLRFEQLREVSDIDRCITLAQTVLQSTPDGHPTQPSRASYLGDVLMSRLNRVGDLGDLNMAVLQYDKALHLTPEDHSDRPDYLMSLGVALWHRFEQLGDLDDLNQSIKLYEDAIQLTPDGDVTRPARLNNLGVALRDRFVRLDDLNDLEKSVQLAETAVQLISNEQVDKPSLLNNLSLSLLYRFRWLGDIDDLNKSVSVQEESLGLTLDNHPERQARLSNLGLCLLIRFQALGDSEDLQRSSLLGEDATRKTPDGHPDKPAWLVNHSASRQFWLRGNPKDLQEMINTLSSAAHSMTGPPYIRFCAAGTWARLAQIEAHPSVLDAYRVSIDLLPVLAWLGLSIKDRHYHIVTAGKVARNAATAAIAAGSLGKAVEWLEQGRSIIWGQLLNLRTPVDDLRQAHPLLANQFISLSARLEGTGTRNSEKGATHSSTHPLNAQPSHDLALERNTLLEEIRRLKGFDRFLLPKTTSELSAAALSGHVVVFNLSDDQCDALVFLPGALDVVHIFLPEFTPELAENLSQSLYGLVHHCGRNERLLGRREGKLNPEEEFAQILSELWTRLVKPVLNTLKITTPSTHNVQRIWWCPTGALTFLPIHAAGIYGANETFGSKLSDFVISSYTPSLTALIQGFRPRSQSQEPLQVLAVAQPSALGQTYIPGTKAEIASIQKHAKGKVPVLRLDANMATVDNVQAGMLDSSWVHFACHGVQNASDPTESALLLAGKSRLTLSSIIKLSLPEADFAFLSACQTATGDEVLKEEAVHLAGGMLSAGYRGVIATMWTIMDSDAPQVASDVYERLFQTSPPDSSRAAEALHHAVRKLREESEGTKPFSHWVPFIHIGV